MAAAAGTAAGAGVDQASLKAHRGAFDTALSALGAKRSEAHKALEGATVALGKAQEAAESAGAAFGILDALWDKGGEFGLKFEALSSAASGSEIRSEQLGGEKVEDLGRGAQGKCSTLAHVVEQRISPGSCSKLSAAPSSTWGSGKAAHKCCGAANLTLHNTYS